LERDEYSRTKIDVIDIIIKFFLSHTGARARAHTHTHTHTHTHVLIVATAEKCVQKIIRIFLLTSKVIIR